MIRTIGSSVFCYCISLLSIIIPSSVTFVEVVDEAGLFEGCDLLRNVTIPSTTAITQTYVANNFPALHDKGISLHLIKERFYGHPLHGITFGNQAVVKAEIKQCLLRKNL